jgi:hypothetical protein
VIPGQFFPELLKEDRIYGCLQQESVTAHTARMSMQAFSNIFGDRITSIGF